MQGFRMIAGDAAETSETKVNKASICHRCWDKPDENTFVGGAPCTGSDTVAIPKDKKCQKIRQTIIFPTCWDGKNLDSPDHKSHVAYGTSRSPGGGGSCSDSKFPVKLPQIMYEVMWDTSSFIKDANNWPASGDPYVYSMNQGGSAAHGDYVFGWKDDSLQKAMDKNCNLNKACPAAGLTTQTPEQYSKCTKKQQAPEPVDGCEFLFRSPEDTCLVLMLTFDVARDRLHARRISPPPRLDTSKRVSFFQSLLMSIS